MLSAFLSATRSVLQYILLDVENHDGVRRPRFCPHCNQQIGSTRSGTGPALRWYDSLYADTSVGPILQFFKVERDNNIHFDPVDPKSQGIVHVSSGAFNPTTKAFVAPGPMQYAVISITFADWAGPENIIELCEKYLSQVVNAVQDGQRMPTLRSANRVL